MPSSPNHQTPTTTNNRVSTSPGKQLGSRNGKLLVNQVDYLADQKVSPGDADVAVSNSSEPSQSSFAFISPAVAGVVSLSIISLATKDANSNVQQRCIEAFFQYFYNAHPFLLPRHQFLQTFKTNPMDPLQIAMCYIGSRYISGSSPASFALKFESFLTTTSAAPKDASMVQAMLLFALGLDGDNDQKRAVEILIEAQSLAVGLGMNKREFAVINGGGSPISEESLRRTWWELYVVSVMVEGFHGRETFHLRDSISTVPVPCEEKDFASGCIHHLHAIEEFDVGSFDNEETDWSSYTYRIAAAQNLDRILQSNQIVFPGDPAFDRLEAYLTNWHLHLPENKRVFFDQLGAFDEMLFQAHMITNVSSMLLHRQISTSEGLAIQTITSCTGQPQVSFGSMTDSIHTVKTTQAAANISKLVALPGSLVKHTHFFICALTLSSITHLSLWSSLPVMAPDQDLKQQIRMNAGALKAIAPIWPSAQMGFWQVTKVAQKIDANRKDAVGEVFWRDFIDEDFTSGLMENNATMDS